jgi:nucleoside-diphosphate-sugar epimerase
MTKLLLLGERSFAASGLYETLKNKGFDVDCFSRGQEGRKGDFISGSVFNLANNKYLNGTYDVVINFIIVKDGDIVSNVEYVKALHQLCEAKKAKNLIQVSSISTYPQDVDLVDETCEIEKDPYKKGHYGALKVAVDHYLSSLQKSYALSFVRPGFIYTGNYEAKAGISGIGKSIFQKRPFCWATKKHRSP